MILDLNHLILELPTITTTIIIILQILNKLKISHLRILILRLLIREVEAGVEMIVEWSHHQLDLVLLPYVNHIHVREDFKKSVLLVWELREL